MKRFYKDTAIEAADGTPQGGYRVLLDGRPMRTPAKTILSVPTRDLAEAIAAEWREVPEGADINVTYLALTRLAATGLDRVPTQRQRVIDDTAKYAGSDLLCYRAPDPPTLVALQHESWQPLLDWAAERYGAKLTVVSGTMFVAQPVEATAKLQRAVAAHSDLALSALYNLAHIAGSLVIALAVSEKHINGEQAFAAAQLDEIYHIEKWGEDPIATKRHAGIAKDLAAGSRFLELLADKRLEI
jgi:chaperone required for assembly of F1-ATPase